MSTRAQSRRHVEEEREQETREARSFVRPRPLTGSSSRQVGDAGHQEECGVGELEVEKTSKGMEGQDEGDGHKCAEVPGDGGEENFGGEFADDLFQPSVERRMLFPAQKRVQRHVHGLERAKDRLDSSWGRGWMYRLRSCSDCRRLKAIYRGRRVKWLLQVGRNPLSTLGTKGATGGSGDRSDHPAKALSRPGATTGTFSPIGQTPQPEEDCGANHVAVLLANLVSRCGRFLQKL